MQNGPIYTNKRGLNKYMCKSGVSTPLELHPQHDSRGNVQGGSHASGLFQGRLGLPGKDFADLGLVHPEHGGKTVLGQSPFVHPQFQDLDQRGLIDLWIPSLLSE